MVLMRKDLLYECVKTYVMKRKEDPYAFFTPSLRTRKFNFSCCEGAEALQNELKNDYIITKELSNLFWQHCAEMWPFACSCQRVFDHSKTC